MGYRRVNGCTVCGKDRCTATYCFRQGVCKNKSQRCSYKPQRNWREYGRGVVRSSGLFKRFRPHVFFLMVREGAWRVYSGPNSVLISMMVDSIGSGYEVYMFSEYHHEMVKWCQNIMGVGIPGSIKGAQHIH